MSQRKITQTKSKFAKLRLPSSFNKSSKSFSPHPRETISSYFSSVLNETNVISNSESTSEEAIIARRCSEIKSTSDTSDVIDFTQPKITRKIETKSNAFESNVKSISNKKNKSIAKQKINHFDSDTNQEHLQLAIALSKSISDIENPKIADNSENSYPSTQQKIMKIKQTLDQFGFKSDKYPGTVSNQRTINVKASKRRKCNYKPTVLFLRTEADRTKLIENKVSQIISNVAIYNKTVEEKNLEVIDNFNNKPRSFILRDYYAEEPIIFKKNSLSISEMHCKTFYNNVIKYPSNVKVGVLLKDWLTIPGREATPPPSEEKILLYDKEDTSIKETTPKLLKEKLLLHKKDVVNVDASMSPELFTDSDDNDNEQIDNYRKSDNSITQIHIVTNSSTKSISLLDNIKLNNDPNNKQNIELSLSPFEPENETKRRSIRKENKNITEDYLINSANSSSLSPFEHIETNKSPKRKITPKKKSSLEKKYVVTPKGRRIISSSFQRNSSFKRSISFNEKQFDKSESICHYENFDNDHIDCFDLTHSSDDELLNLDKLNSDITNRSFTITQLINDFSPTKNKSLNSEVESSDTQASIETIKLNFSNIPDDRNNYDHNQLNLESQYSPEFDCQNLSDNKVFYETLNNSTISEKIHSSDDDLTNYKSGKEIDVSNLELDKNENNNKESILSSTNIKKSEDILKKYASQSESCRYINHETRKRSMLRRSYSENFIDNNKFKSPSKQFDCSPRLGQKKLSMFLNKSNEDNFNFSQNQIEYNNQNDIEFLSQSISTCSDISDEELNYSCGFIKSVSSNDEDLYLSDTSSCNLETNISNCNSKIEILNADKSYNIENSSSLRETINNTEKLPFEEIMIKKINTPKSNTDFIVRTKNITPKGNYSDMDTPERNRELDKFGLKPLKRNKGVKMLHYIYDTMHPFVDKYNEGIIINSSDDTTKVIKRRKINHEIDNEGICSINFPIRNNNIEQRASQIAESEQVEDMIFERKQSSKISSCRLPLHIAWYNLITSSKELQENVLTYKPIQVEEIYKKFKYLGYKFHIQDIITFLDKKCVTISIAQNNRKQKK